MDSETEFYDRYLVVIKRRGDSEISYIVSVPESMENVRSLIITGSCKLYPSSLITEISLRKVEAEPITLDGMIFAKVLF